MAPYRYVHRRRCRAGSGRLTLLLSLADEAGDVREVEVPARYEICDRCQGTGTHTNPSIDGNGISEDEWDGWGEEEQEMYLTGGYDVPCEAGCQGGKLLVPNDDACNPEQLEALREWRDEESEWAREGREDARTRWYEDGCPMD